MIPHNPSLWAAHFPPTLSDTLYWREQHYLESRKARHRRFINRPNPDLARNAAQYWEALWNGDDDNTTQQS